MYYSYLVRCSDGTLYGGYTVDLFHRIQCHNGLLRGGARYTESRRPVTLVQAWCHASRREALRHEAAVKLLTRRAKLRLVGW